VISINALNLIMKERFIGMKIDAIYILDLTPCPLSCKARGRDIREGASPLLFTTPPPSRWEGGKGDGQNMEKSPILMP
jgi:hypothetical protein